MPRPPSMIVVRGEEQSTSAELHAPARRMLVEYEARAAGRQGVGPISDHCTLKIGYGARDDVPLSCERLQTLGSRRSTAPSAERRFDCCGGVRAGARSSARIKELASRSRFETDMKKKRFTEQQIIDFLKEAESGAPVKDLYRNHGFSDWLH